MASSKTPREARVAVQASFLAHWQASAHASIPIAWRNKDRPSNGSSFVAFTFQHTLGDLAALGQELFRRSVLITVQLYMATEGEGEAASDAALETVLAWAESFNVSGFRLREGPSPNELGNFGGYYQAVVTLGVEYDALRS